MSLDERVELLRELERADEAIAAELAELDELHAAVEEVRGRAAGLGELLARLPKEREAARAALEEAGRALAEAREAAEQASRELKAAGEARDDERLAAARRFELRARDHLHVAERKEAAAREHADELDARAVGARTETVELDARAGGLAGALTRRSRLAAAAVAEPGRGPQAVAEWGTRARAALLVARGQLAAARDAVVRQTAELGALLLGEPLPATSAAGVARRVERELGAG